ncbi:PAN/Apple domain-containing protein [Planktomarina temperata]|nr:PAN/Apple domain-containing protein [Planktomarina temperata]
MVQYFKALGLALLFSVGIGSVGNAGSAEVLEPYLEVFDEFYSLDIVGGDLTENGFKGVNEKECQEICLENGACTGYSFVSQKNWCFLKDSTSQTIQNSEVTSGFLRRFNRESLNEYTMIYEQDLEMNYRQWWFVVNIDLPDLEDEVTVVVVKGDGKLGDFYGNLLVNCKNKTARWLLKGGVAEVPKELYLRLGKVYCGENIRLSSRNALYDN